MEDLNYPSSVCPAEETKKPWHMPEVRVSSVPAITANAHCVKSGDGAGVCAS
jgi:hypothetical protein